MNYWLLAKAHRQISENMKVGIEMTTITNRNFIKGMIQEEKLSQIKLWLKRRRSAAVTRISLRRNKATDGFNMIREMAEYYRM